MQIRTTPQYDKWFSKLKDLKAKQAITIHLRKLSELDYFGDHKFIDANLFELRIFVGKGYRIYGTKKGNTFVILLCAGDKSNKKSQQEDIEKAKRMIREILK